MKGRADTAAAREPAPNPPGSPGWWQARTTATSDPARAPVTVRRIVTAALALIDREGLNALSMRNLATELETGTATLYRHIGGKDEVVALVVDEIIGDAHMENAMDADGWRDALEAGARSLRAALLSHPNAVPLFAASMPVGPNALRGRNQLLGALRRYGLPADLAADVMVAVLQHVVGSALLDPMVEFHGEGGTQAPSLTLREFFGSLPPDQFPELIASADRLTSRSPGSEFEFGLGLLLDGIESRLNRPESRRRE